MGRPPVVPAEEKTQIVPSVLSGEVSIAEAARKERVSETSMSRWEAEVEDLTQALGEAAVELRVWKKSAEGRLGPTRTSR